LRREFEGAGEAGPLEADAAQARIDDWTQRIGSLREMAADASSYLPSYDAEQAGQLMAKLEEEFGVAKGLVQPRRRFAFRRKGGDSAPAASGGGGGGAGGGGGDAGVEGGAPKRESALDRLEREITAGERKVERQSGQCIVLDPVDSDGGLDLRLLDLHDCVVFMYVLVVVWVWLGVVLCLCGCGVCC
jgi:hypothetical protein